MLNTAEIKRRRLKLKYSFAAAAIEAGWGKEMRARWYEIESGRRTDITTATLISMAKALRCTPNDLLIIS